MGVFLVLIAVLAPLFAAAVTAVVRPVGLASGRMMAVGCGVGAIASIGLLIWSGSNPKPVPGDGAILDLGVDRVTALLLTAVLGLAAVVASFARRNVDVDPRAPQFFGWFGVLVTGSALVVVPASPWLLLGGWVSSGWALVALVGHLRTSSARRSQWRVARALFVGDVALVAALLVAVRAAGQEVTSDVGGSLDALRSYSVLGASGVDVVAVLLVVAGISKSSLVPLHRWLIATLAAPTPVSALVHAGFVSGAGLLLLRFAPLVVDSTVAIHAVFAVGAFTTILAIGAGRTRVDVKGRLVWSTVSQMGFMVVQCAAGAFSSAVFHIIGHGMYKASMFLGAGDAVSASLRSKRRAAPAVVPPVGVRMAATLAIATIAVGVGVVVLPPDVSDGGVVLVVVFAWLTVAHGAWGFLGRGALAPTGSIAAAAVGGGVAVAAYLGGLRAIESFLEPALRTIPKDGGVDATVVVVMLVVGVLAAAATSTAALRRPFDIWLERIAHPHMSHADVRPSTAVATGKTSVASSTASTSSTAPTASNASLVSGDETVASPERRSPAELSRVRADVARAQVIVAPAWPLSSFVAVNPLGGLEEIGFDRATQAARRELGARTHLSLDRYRADHAAGRTTTEDLRWAIASSFLDLHLAPSVDVNGQEISATRIVELDLLYGPEVDEEAPPLTALERVEGVDGPIGRMIDLSISHSVAHHLVAPQIDGAPTFARRWRRDATSISALRRHLSAAAIDWLDELDDDPALAISVALSVSGVANEQRVAELRGQFARLSGWVGFARWRTEWAQADETTPRLRPIEIAAARCALEAAWLRCHPDAAPLAVQPTSSTGSDDTERVAAVIAALGGPPPDAAAIDRIRAVIATVAPAERAGVWLTAQERHVDRATLGLLDRLDPGAHVDTPDAQFVFCIDVRSEGLRRHLESTGHYGTLGFAGFFGVPMSIRRLEWTRAETRCPVLVAPSVRAAERPRIHSSGELADTGGVIARSRLAAAASAVHHHAKYGTGAAFVMAEAAGWVAGPVAATRTLVPSSPTVASARATTMEFDRLPDEDTDLAQRADIGEAVLTTMGLTEDFARLVVLCGHASGNVNNPHGTALDCGACAGASGQDNARAVAALLNEPGVRLLLGERGIDVPDETHFLPGLHDTVSDRVDFFDLDDLPESHRPVFDKVRNDLAWAAEANAAERAIHLPGPAGRVRQRGTDWAQIRPEWGLAGNAGFIIGPRSMTAGLDLGGRSFLHSYDADRDPEGKVLETIMTAPLVVAHWISSQYYFSTVDPERFGAGDKLVHNVVGDLGVVSGEGGDLRIGLPLQSTHLADRAHHQAVRLLAVIQAPLERIERIIQQNSVLTTLVRGGWMRIAGRSHPHERWSIRTAGGTWSEEPRETDHPTDHPTVHEPDHTTDAHVDQHLTGQPAATTDRSTHDDQR